MEIISATYIFKFFFPFQRRPSNTVVFSVHQQSYTKFYITSLFSSKQILG